MTTRGLVNRFTAVTRFLAFFGFPRFLVPFSRILVFILSILSIHVSSD